MRPWWQCRLRITRSAPYWGYTVKAPRKYANHPGESLLFREALWNGLCDLTGRWRWRIPRDRLCLPDWKNTPIETDNWNIHLDCGHMITRSYMNDPLRELPVDQDDEPQAYCPEHGFERVWFTSGVLDPDAWYDDCKGQPGHRYFGGSGPDHFQAIA